MTYDRSCTCCFLETNFNYRHFKINVDEINASRLAEGHAKLMYRTKVEVVDAVMAAELIGTTLISTDVGCPFPTDPISTYHSKGMRAVKFI